MEITVTLDQALTIQELLINAITRIELNNIKAIQERETLNRVNIALLLQELSSKAAI
jgi:hypothetical protein